MLCNPISPFAAELRRLYHLSAKDARLAEKMFTNLDVPADTELAWEGRSTRQLVLVLDGEVEILRNGERIDVLGPGAVIGEISALGIRRYQTASARTTKPSRIAAAGTRDIAFLNGCTGLYLHMQHLASKRTAAQAPH